MNQIPLDLSLFDEMSKEEVFEYLEGKYSKEVMEEVKDYVEGMWGKIDEEIIEI